jgi:hypothetical protein
MLFKGDSSSDRDTARVVILGGIFFKENTLLKGCAVFDCP